MRRALAWVAAVVACVVLPWLAHASVVPGLRSGRYLLGERVADSDADVTVDIAADAGRRIADVWHRSPDLGSFLLRDLWVAQVYSGVGNIVDCVLVIDPLIDRIGLPFGWTVLQLGIVSANMFGAVVAAALLGGGWSARAAAALVAGTSGAATWALEWGQPANGFVAPHLVGMAALAALWRARGREAAAPAVAAVLAAVVAAHWYWLNGVILLVGAAAFAVGSLAERRAPTRATVVAGLCALVAVGVLLAPAARPMLAAVGAASARSVDSFLRTAILVGDLEQQVLAMGDALRWRELVDLDAGYALPAWPLLPLVALGLVAPGRRAWLLVLGIAAALAVGPLPTWPESVGGRAAALSGWLFSIHPNLPAAELDGLPRARNLVYEAVLGYWPLGARMRHPVRWATLATAAHVALVVAGTQRLADRFPRAAAVLVGLAALALLLGGALALQVRTSDWPASFLAR